MNFGRMASLVIAVAAVLGVFIEIPVVSDFAFWVLVAAYFVWVGIHAPVKGAFSPGRMASIVLLLVAIAGLFIEIPIVSEYAFWVLAAAYLVMLGTTNLWPIKVEQ